MRLAGKSTSFLIACLWAAVPLFGQSLGDVAREHRQKQQANGQVSPKVITNEDIPESTPADSEVKKPGASERPSSSRRSAQQWKSEIQAQERLIANLQDQIQRLSGSVHYTYFVAHTVNAERYNQRQEQKQEEIQRMQEQLAREQQKLADLQEAARKDGFGNAVYEP